MPPNTIVIRIVDMRICYALHKYLIFRKFDLIVTLLYLNIGLQS